MSLVIYFISLSVIITITGLIIQSRIYDLDQKIDKLTIEPEPEMHPMKQLPIKITNESLTIHINGNGSIHGDRR